MPLAVPPTPSPYSTSVADTVREFCVMEGEGQCVVRLLKKHTAATWIECERCHSWYHCVCAGIEVGGFCCCEPPEVLPHPVYVINNHSLNVM